MLNRKSDRIEEEVFFSPGKKTVAVKTAMKRIGIRSGKIKNLCYASRIVFYRSRFMKIGTHSHATAPLKRAQMMRTVQLHCPINAQIGPVNNQSDTRMLL